MVELADNWQWRRRVPRILKRTPGMSEGGLASFLDFDGDGDVSDDVAKIGAALAGSGLLGKLFAK